MLIPDMPSAPPQTPAIVMVAQTNQTVRNPASTERSMGVCYVVANVPGALEKYGAGVFPSQSLVYPWEDVSAYFSEFEQRNINIYEGNIGPLDTSSSVVVQPPKHGTLVDAGRGKYQAYYYKPDAGYYGDDSAVIQAEVNGLKVKIHYYFHSLDTEVYSESAVCGEKGYIWKISTNPDAPLVTATLQSLLSFTGLDSSIKVDISDLSGSAVAQTTGESITNGAGSGLSFDIFPPPFRPFYCPFAVTAVNTMGYSPVRRIVHSLR